MRVRVCARVRKEQKTEVMYQYKQIYSQLFYIGIHKDLIAHITLECIVSDALNPSFSHLSKFFSNSEGI